MKYLKIEDNKGYFLRPDSTNGSEEWVEIDKISREDLMLLLNKVISSEFEMDEYSEPLLANKAHQIVYKNLYEKILELELSKSKFKDESENLYKDAIEKYNGNEERN